MKESIYVNTKSINCYKNSLKYSISLFLPVVPLTLPISLYFRDIYFWDDILQDKPYENIKGL